MGSWYDEYKELDPYNGRISFVSEDDEDMIEIRYKDGMLIDVGYIERLNSYVITVVSSDTEEGWKDPLEQITVNNRSELSDTIQDTICKYRQMDYPTFLSELITPVLPFLRGLKESRKKLGIGAAGIVIMLCTVRGIVQKIWQGSFWNGFLYQLALLFAVFIISSFMYFLMKKAPSAGSFILGTFIILGIAFLLGVILLVILLLLNSFLHFWF